MKHKISLTALTAAFTIASVQTADACTNFIVTPGASTDGSAFITYSADDYGMFGTLCYYPASRNQRGAMRDIVDWDTHVWHGQIPEAPETYSVIGNINEHQLSIAETTYGGRHEMEDSTGMIDYGSLIYLALQRAKTAREAIEVMTTLADKYGYCSSGESFSIADPKEAWILEMMGAGAGSKDIVWVAVRIPDGAISAHANQARIGNISELKKSTEVLTSKNVVSFARKKGWFSGKDEEFSWKNVYAFPDFEARRMCDARVWSFFRRFKDMSRYEAWALGEDPKAEDMPLWIVPERKVALADVMDAMRDHYEGTSMSLADTTTLAGGIWQMPYRPTPLTFDEGGKTYFSERPISTQQTAFTFVAQMRASLPDHIGGVLWFGNDDANMVAYTPIYCSSTRRPVCYNTPGADALTFSFQNAFWVCNWVSNMVYPRYTALFPDLLSARQELEERFLKEQAEVESRAKSMSAEEARQMLNDYSISAAATMMDRWMALAQLLIVKHNDMAVKPQAPDGSFLRTPEGIGVRVRRPGYSQAVKRLLIERGEAHAEP